MNMRSASAINSEDEGRDDLHTEAMMHPPWLHGIGERNKTQRRTKIAP